MSKQEQRLDLLASVVIPTWNAAAFVERVLELLVSQDCGPFEVLVVDNGVVNRETQQVSERFHERIPNLRYLAFEKQLGYAGAVNEGVAAAKADLVAVLNNDNLPDKRWLAELVAAYQRAKAEGREAIISSLVARADFQAPLAARMNLWGRIVRTPKVPVYVPFHPDGSAFLFSKGAFGLPYDQEYFIYHEDVYLGWRAWLEGHEVQICQASRAETFDGGSTRRIAYRTAFFTERNRWLNYLLFLSWPALLCVLPLLKLDAIAKLALGNNRRAKLHAWLWLIFHLVLIGRKRAAVQAKRRRSDAEILPLLSGKYADGDGLVTRSFNALFRAYFRLLGVRLGA